MSTGKQLPSMCTCVSRHGITTKKTWILSNTASKTSNLAKVLSS